MTSNVQSLPCNIAYEGDADVAARLLVKGQGAAPASRARACARGSGKPRTLLGDDLQTAFRGRRLLGRDVPTPPGVVGVVLEERDGAPAVRSTFGSVRVWGHDEAPPSDHYVLESLDVVAALTALHAD